MNQRFHKVFILLTVFGFAGSASAQDRDPGPAVELFGARVQAIDTSEYHEESFGLRGGYRFGNVWALEGSLSRLDTGFEAWFADASAKAYFVHSNRFEIYGLAGPGVFSVSAFGESEDQATVHLGLGAEIALGDRLYLRPEARGHWFTDELKFNDGLADYALGIGWRF